MEAKMGDRGRLTAGGLLALGARQWRWGPPGWTLKTQSLWPGEASTVPSEASRGVPRDLEGECLRALGWERAHAVTSPVA